ncbi:MAG: RNA-directed DNA polymerase [Planctomycetaceae bacterium]|nr:RNA-directed DNA polymerase [Planctomycetaceae bacterium]
MGQQSRRLAEAIAQTVLNGPFAFDAIVSRLKRITPGPCLRGWKQRVARSVLDRFGEGGGVPSLFTLRQYLIDSGLLIDVEADDFPEDWIDETETTIIRPDRVPHAVFCPRIAAFQNLGLPEWTTTRELADWFGLTDGQLLWLSGGRRSDGKSAFERYRLKCQRSSSGKVRCLEVPRSMLKSIQRELNRDLLTRIPIHSCAHGFVPGRSIHSYVEPHVGQDVIWKTDLANFFPSITRSRIEAQFRLFGYPDAVARTLSGLMTVRQDRTKIEELSQQFPRDQFRDLASLLTQSHLPQGAPTSPALANLAAYRLDCRLSGLATKFHANYTRYADDLTYSGGQRFQRSLDTFRVHALAIIVDEGFRNRLRKTRVMMSSRRQTVAGLVINQTQNVPREEYKTLKAILFNCRLHGPASQNRDGIPDFQAHLRGRIEFVRSANPERGEKLMAMFEEIEFHAET